MRPGPLLLSALLLLTCASPAEADGPSGTLVVPIEYADLRFKAQGTARTKALTQQIQGVAAYYETLLRNDVGAGPPRKPIGAAFPHFARFVVAAPIRMKGTQRDYGRDRLRLEWGFQGFPRVQFQRDVGSGKRAYDGQRRMKREAFAALAARGVRVRQFRSVVFVSAGQRGNRPGSPNLWPTSAGRAGVIVCEEDGLDLWVHEMGHQLGLPDLYLDPGRTGTDAGPVTEMGTGASRRQAPIGQTALERAFLARRAGLPQPVVTRLKPQQGGKVTLVARTARVARTRSRALLVADRSGKPGGWLVEVFDRRGLDQNLAAVPPPRVILARLQALLRGDRGARLLAPLRRGVLISRVDAFAVRELKTFQPLGGSPLGELLPADVANRTGLFTRVFQEGDRYVGLDGTTLVVKALRERDGVTEAALEIVRGAPPSGARARTRQRMRALREQLMRRVRDLIGS